MTNEMNIDFENTELEAEKVSSVEVETIKEDAKFTAKTNRGKNKTYSARVLREGKGFIDIDFKGFGIRVKTDVGFNSDKVNIEYRGEIGTPNFEFKLV